MKAMKLMMAVLAMVFGFQAYAGDVPADKEVVVGINDAYIPGGFDTGSDVYVVTSGIFQNACYHWKRAEVSHTSQFTHEVRTVAGVNQGMCLMVLVPFTKEVRLGKFDAGKHTIRFIDGNGTYIEKTMVVEE